MTNIESMLQEKKEIEREIQKNLQNFQFMYNIQELRIELRHEMPTDGINHIFDVELKVIY